MYLKVVLHCKHHNNDDSNKVNKQLVATTVAVLAQSVERVDCRAGGRGFDSWGRTNTQGTLFALQQARPSRGSDDYVQWRSRLQLET